MASSSHPDEGDRRRRSLVFFDQTLLAARDYWLATLARELQPSNIPLDRTKRNPSDGRDEQHTLTLQGDTWSRVRKLTENKPGLIHILLTAACATVLYRLTGSNVIVLGTPARGGDSEPNALPLVIDVTPDQTFRTLLSEVRRIASEAYTHQCYTHAAIVRDFGLIEDGVR